MTTQKDHIEKLEIDMLAHTESTQKLTHTTESIERTLKELSTSFAKFGGESSRQPGTEITNPHHSWQSHNCDHHTNGHYTKLMKMDMPRFSGDDPLVWLDQVAQFFEYQKIEDDKKVTLATFYLEEEANQLWKWLKTVTKLTI